jgi:hypothetical protein
VKPEVTKQLEADDPILPPRDVARYAGPVGCFFYLLSKSHHLCYKRVFSGRRGVIAGIEKWSFLISPSGFNTDSAAVVCSGLAPRSFIDYLKATVMWPILNIATAMVFHYKFAGFVLFPFHRIQ